MKLLITLLIISLVCISCNTDVTKNEQSNLGAYIIGPIDAPILAWKFIDEGEKDPGPDRTATIRIDGTHQLKGKIMFVSDLTAIYDDQYNWAEDLGDLEPDRSASIGDVYSCNDAPVMLKIYQMNRGGSVRIALFLNEADTVSVLVREVNSYELVLCLGSGFTKSKHQISNPPLAIPLDMFDTGG